MAVASGHGLHQDQAQRANDQTFCEHAARRCRRHPQPRAAELGAYFRYGNSSHKFAAVDSYVHLRLAMLASDEYGLHGLNWVTRFTHG
jgi:hypothetical protein